MRELKIFSGRANQDLAKKICRHLHLDPAAITLGKFPDGENYCKLDEDVRGRDVFLVQPTSPPVNDNLIELLIMIDCCKRASAERITAVIPFLAYARQDRKSLPREPITARLTQAPGNGAAIGGLKVVTENGWFAARPSGTEDIYKIYAESFRGSDHLRQIQEEAQAIVSSVFQR